MDDPAPVRVVRQGDGVPLDGAAEIVLEDGSLRSATGMLPTDLPCGYHLYRTPQWADPGRLIVTPHSCFWLDGMRAWGWMVQLYACHSSDSWGIGDLGDLRRLGTWAKRLGAGVLLLNPLGAVTPGLPPEPSPYLPSSRLYRNPLYLRIETVPGAADSRLALDHLAAAGRRLGTGDAIDRAAVWQVKRAALRCLWTPAWDTGSGLAAFRREQGPLLHRFATFCALAERYRTGWTGWPPEYRHPEAPAVARFAAAHEGEVRFHEWVQWLLDEQVRVASREVALIQDLPVGAAPDGADAWLWQDLLAPGVSVGAPPDGFNPLGQVWGCRPFEPDRLRAAAYEPFIRLLRAGFRHAAGLRLDHVMGLFRLFWIADGTPPAEGHYVPYPAEDLLGILALESHRARAFLIGEDLGTVEPGVRERLATARVLSSRVLWFEPGPPAEYPVLAAASVSTHDLPTIAGLWTGHDVARQQALGLEPDVKGLSGMRAGLRDALGVPDGARPEVVIAGTARLLARAPCAILLMSLEDACAAEHRPNLPGTVGPGFLNWSRSLPCSLEALEEAPLPRLIADALRRDGA